MNNKRRLLANAIFMVGVVSTSPWVVAEENFPGRPIKVVVAFAAGTGGDGVARIVTNAMGSALGQSIIVENRAGAGGVVGTEQGARAAPDGYTLTLGTTSTLLTNPALNPNVRYRAETDFVPIGALARTSFVVVTANSPDAPRSLAELLARLKQPGNPSFGSAGVGTLTHLTTELLLKRTGVTATHVPYRGSSQSLTDVAGGQLLFATDTLVAALPLIRGGKLRALAVTSGERLASMPAVPTVSESGVPDFRVTAWWGLMVPAGTPPSIVKKLSDATLKALGTSEVKAQLAAQELEPFPLGSQAFGQQIRSELPLWTDFVRQLGLRIEF